MNRKILVVDDSQIARQDIAKPLRDAGHDITEAGDGLTALKLASQTQFDIIISDVHMPEMNGIELCEALKDKGVTPFPVILIVSTESNAELKTRGKQAGVKGWIIKPIKAETLLQVIQKLQP